MNIFAHKCKEDWSFLNSCFLSVSERQVGRVIAQKNLECLVGFVSLGRECMWSYSGILLHKVWICFHECIRKIGNFPVVW